MKAVDWWEGPSAAKPEVAWSLPDAVPAVKKYTGDYNLYGSSAAKCECGLDRDDCLSRYSLQKAWGAITKFFKGIAKPMLHIRRWEPPLPAIQSYEPSPLAVTIECYRQLQGDWHTRETSQSETLDLLRNIDREGWKDLPRQMRGRAEPMQVIEELTGKVERVEGNVAHVTLVDRYGREMAACADTGELSGHGVREGGRFRCTIVRRGREIVTTLEPIPKRRLSDDDWKRLREETVAALGDFDPANDY